MPGPTRPAAAALLVAAVLAAVSTPAAALRRLPRDGRAEAASFQTPIVYAETNKALRPTRLQAYGRTHYYQLATDPVGTLVFFHGCSRSAKGFFPYDPVHCPECWGLPEDVSHTKQALARGYTLLALEPNDAKHLCWSSTTRDGYVNDQPDVIATITKFLLDQSLYTKPVYFAGASSGGTLALKLPATLYLAARSAGALSLTQASAMAQAFNGSASAVPILSAALAATGAVMMQSSSGSGGNGTDGERTNATSAPFFLQVQGIIAEVSTPTDFGAADSAGRLRWPNYPPTIFVTMERDTSGQREAQTNVDFFTRNRKPSGVVQSPMRQITPTFFSDRSPVISLEQSTRIVAAFKDIGLLDRNGWLLANPKDHDVPASRAYQWPTKLQRMLPWVGKGALTLQFRQSLIHQSLLMAYANHEHVSDYLSVCLAWLESGGFGSLSSLTTLHSVPGYNLTALTGERQWPTDPPINVSSGAPPPAPPAPPSPPAPPPQPSPSPSPPTPSPPPPSPSPPRTPRFPSPPPTGPPPVRQPPPPPPRRSPPPPIRRAPHPHVRLSPPPPNAQRLPPSPPPPWWGSAAPFFGQGQPASPPRPPSPPPSPPSPPPRPPFPSSASSGSIPGDPGVQPDTRSPPLPHRSPPPPAKRRSPPPPQTRRPPPPPPVRRCSDDKRCTRCSSNNRRCTACLAGFRPDASGVCVLACNDPACLECRLRSSWCVRCAAGYTRLSGKCRKA